MSAAIIPVIIAAAVATKRNLDLQEQEYEERRKEIRATSKKNLENIAKISDCMREIGKITAELVKIEAAAREAATRIKVQSEEVQSELNAQKYLQNARKMPKI